MAEIPGVKLRIEQRVKDLQIETYAELARMLKAELDKAGIKKTEHVNIGIYNWGKRDSIPNKYLPALAKILKCSPEWLQFGAGTQFTNLPNLDNDKQCAIPIYYDKRGLNIEMNEAKDSLIVEKQWFRDVTGLEHVETFRLMVATTDGMQPTISPGDMLLIDIADVSPVDGIFLVQHGEMPVTSEIKRLSCSADSISLISDNARYPVKSLSRSDVRLMGRAKYLFKGERL